MVNDSERELLGVVCNIKRFILYIQNRQECSFRNGLYYGPKEEYNMKACEKLEMVAKMKNPRLQKYFWKIKVSPESYKCLTNENFLEEGTKVGSVYYF